MCTYDELRKKLLNSVRVWQKRNSNVIVANILGKIDIKSMLKKIQKVGNTVRWDGKLKKYVLDYKKTSIFVDENLSNKMRQQREHCRQAKITWNQDAV